jgi:hypothetical protein
MSFRLLRVARTCRILKLAQNRKAFSWYLRHFCHWQVAGPDATPARKWENARLNNSWATPHYYYFPLGQIFRFPYIVGPTLPLMVMVLSLPMRMHTNSLPHPAAIFRIVSRGRGWIDIFRCAAARIVIAKIRIQALHHCQSLPIDQFTMYRRIGLMSFGHQISNWETGNLYFPQGELPTTLNQPSENAGRLRRKSGWG